MANLGWWVVSGDKLLNLLRRAYDGEDPDILFAEIWANAESKKVDPEKEENSKSFGRLSRIFRGSMPKKHDP